jgi:hypothetical protein
MKVYTLGNHGFVPVPVAKMLGMTGIHRQARILIAASSKAEAFRLVSERGIGPESIHDKEFRVAQGDDVDVLAHVGLLAAPAVFALDNSAVTEVVRIEQDGSPTLLGRTERANNGTSGPLRFIPTAAGVHGPVWTGPLDLDTIAKVVAEMHKVDTHRATELTRDCVLGIVDDPSKWNEQLGQVDPEAVPELLGAIGDQLSSEDEDQANLIAACEANRRRVEELNAELEKLRAKRQELAQKAVHMDLVAEAASAFNLSAGRIYQLKDAALVAAANERRKAVGRTPGIGEVQRCVALAINRRIGYVSEHELIEVRDGAVAGSVVVQVNSDGNSLAAEEALRDAGYIVQPLPQGGGHGCSLLVTRATA